jgi:hypothetical protein
LALRAHVRGQHDMADHPGDERSGACGHAAALNRSPSKANACATRPQIEARWGRDIGEDGRAAELVGRVIRPIAPWIAFWKGTASAIAGICRASSPVP